MDFWLTDDHIALQDGIRSFGFAKGRYGYAATAHDLKDGVEKGMFVVAKCFLCSVSIDRNVSPQVKLSPMVLPEISCHDFPEVWAIQWSRNAFMRSAFVGALWPA